MENPIKIDDLGVPLFLETPIYHTSILWNWSPCSQLPFIKALASVDLIETVPGPCEALVTSLNVNQFS